jgi:hypothetical protein
VQTLPNVAGRTAILFINGDPLEYQLPIPRTRVVRKRERK